MFGTRQPNPNTAPQSSRTRRQNVRPASPGPSTGGGSGGGGSGGGGLFASQSGASGKAPAGTYREREHYQAELTQDQKDEIADAFNLFDLNQDRRIDYHELKVAMKALGFDTPKPELLDIIRRHGVTPAGVAPPPNTPATNLYITYEAFMDIMTQKIADRDPLEEIGRAFELFAGVGSGGRQDGREPKIGIDDLRRVAKELGENLEEEELQAMIDEFDIDNDGMISREEFIAICKGD